MAGGLSRRDALVRLGGGFGALGLASVLAEGSDSSRPARFAPRAKRVIHLFMNGGPSHLDSFDPKPELTRRAGEAPPQELIPRGRSNGALLASPFKFARHGESGIDVSELFPHVAGCADDPFVIRSMHTDIPNHEPSLLMMNSGATQPTRPSLGSWLCYGLGSENQNLPGFVVLCPGKPVVGPQLWSNSFLPGVYQGVHVDNTSLDPEKVVRHIRSRHVSRDAQRRQLDLLARMNQEHLASRAGDAQLEGRISALEMAFRMQFEAQEAFDISRESAETLALYGEGEFAQGCLVARRLAERGVRMTQIFFGNGQPWDDHGDVGQHAVHAGKSDRAIAALLVDLKRRGLLDETLVIWGGEFGRTPSSEGGKGRDHNNLGFTVWLAGGGVRGGHVHGATDELGFGAVRDKVHVHDLHATVLHLLGLDHEQLTYRYAGRDFRLTDVYGNVVREILA